MAAASTAAIAEPQRRIDALSSALARMNETTMESGRCCEGLTRRARHLDSLTSPASDASAMLTQASTHLTATLAMMKDAREKFDTVSDCEPAIERLFRGAQDAVERKAMASSVAAAADDMTVGGGGGLTEQDVYAAADSMEILRDAHVYFFERQKWKSSPSALAGLERVHQLGIDAMCLLVKSHLSGAGPAVRIKRSVKGADRGNTIAGKLETSSQTRDRLSAALQNRDLMKSVGEYEEYLPLDTRAVRELRAIFECLGGDGSFLGPSDEGRRPLIRNPNPSRITRTEKVGSGHYCNIVKEALKTTYPHLDVYGEARKTVAFTSMDSYYRHLKAERKRVVLRRKNSATDTVMTMDASGDADAAARDTVRCLEHAMVVVAGEKSIYRCVVSPTSSHTHDETKIPDEYKQALVSSYSYVVAAVVDRVMDIIETVFMKEAGLGQNSRAIDESLREDGSPGPIGPGIRETAYAAAAGLRILDGVRMLGPSLAKLCEIAADKHTKDSQGRPEQSMSVAASLCISIHRTTVKNSARTLESLAKAIQNDPLDGEKHRPMDARVATVSSDVVKAVRLVSPFVSAYKSVTKRRALPWDPSIGEEAGDLDSFIRFLVMRLLHNLQGKALNYTKDPGLDSLAKSNLFMMNNTFYILEQLSPIGESMKPLGEGEIDGDEFKIESPWFQEKVGKLFETEKSKYLAHWEVLNKHLTAVDKNDLSYQSGQLLSLESGRLLKIRFNGFIEEFEKTYPIHKELTIIDPKLRLMLRNDVKNVFFPRYVRFFEMYSQIHFSKKNMDQYLKYPPAKVETMLENMFTTL